MDISTFLARLATESEALLDELPAFVVLSRPDGSVAYRNRAWRSFIGPEAHDSTKSPWDRFVHPEDLTRVVASWSSARERGDDEFEIQYRLRDAATGKYHWMRSRTVAIRNEKGEIDHYVGVGVLNDDYVAVARTQAQLQALVDANIIGIATATLDPPRIMFANDEFLRMIGYTRDDFDRGAIDWWTITPPEWHEADRLGMEELRTTGVCRPFEKEYFRKDGSRVPFLIGATLLPESKNEEICYALDLSNLRAVQTRERTMSQRFEFLATLGKSLASASDLRAVLRTTVAGVVPAYADWALINVLDERGVPVVSAARHRDEALEAELQSLIGHSYVAASPETLTTSVMKTSSPAHYPVLPDDVLNQTVKEEWRPLLRKLDPRSAVVVPLVVGGTVFGTLNVNFSSSGRAYEAEDIPFIADIALRAAQAIENARRYDAERALLKQIKHSEHELRTLAEAIPVIVWSADASGWIDWYNHGWYEFTGQTPEEAAGWGWQAAHHPDDFQRVMDAWPKSIASGDPFEMEFRLRRHDGVYHTFLTRIRPLRNDRGEVIRWYGSNIDIQGQKEALERSRWIAEKLQGVFLPDEFPQAPMMRIDGVYESAEQDALIGGDWFDAMKLEDGRYLLSIGDVTGHGIEASVIAGRLRYAIRDYAGDQSTAAGVIKAVNRIMFLEYPEKFATVIVAFVDADCKRVSYSCAGHPPPIFARGSQVEVLNHGGIMLGVQREALPLTHVLDIEKNDVFVLYSDGFVENTRNYEDGEQELRRAVAAVASDASISRPALALQRMIFGGKQPADDAALLAVRFSEPLPKRNAGAPEPHKTWRFHSSDSYTAHRTRHEVIAFLEACLPHSGSFFEAELILGELLAEVVQCAPGLVEFSVDWTGEKPVVTVRDPRPDSGLTEAALGSSLVQTLADEVVVKNGNGRYAELRVTLPLSRK